jgi:ATPase subunit of ABC transporter with duplicated ATPase domains
MIVLDKVAMNYGEKLLFDDVNLALKSNKYGLVGANGAGKSTFFRLILGEEELSGGEITVPRGITIGSLKQDLFKYQNDKVVDVVMQGKPKLWQAIREQETLSSKADISEEECYRIGELSEIIMENDGYEAESQAQAILMGLGVDVKDHFVPLQQLSGGYKLRILLAQSIFGKPDVLLLDEPNNHLDILSIQWLENYLINDFKGTLILISHDHDFLNNICDHILDVDYGEINLYVGNYDAFVIEKQRIVDQKEKDRVWVEKYLEKQRRFVERFRASAARSKQAASREKQLNKVEVPELKNTSRVPPKFAFIQKDKSGKEVIEIDSISKSFTEKKLFQKVSFKVLRGDKIAVIGKNGIGKSTILKTILGLIKPDSGSISWGHNVLASYFSQDHHDLVKGDYNVGEWLMNETRVSEINTIRSVLARMLFCNDDVNKHLSVLSGGEAARLLFASLIMKQGNTMILDEPTNHLDLESRVALANALKKFDGSIICVSHDRSFISAMADRIIFVYENGYVDFKGSYHEFVQKYHRLLV